jgi:hypothetical protein
MWVLLLLSILRKLILRLGRIEKAAPLGGEILILSS